MSLHPEYLRTIVNRVLDIIAREEAEATAVILTAAKRREKEDK